MTRDEKIFLVILVCAFLCGLIIKDYFRHGDNAQDMCAGGMCSPMAPVSEERKPLPDKPVDINTGSLSELMLLPGIGSKTAQKIIEYRAKKSFLAPEELKNVDGIGEKTYNQIKDFIFVTK